MSFLRAKCLPTVFYPTEDCPLLATEHSFEFSVTRIFMKVVCIGSLSIVKECECRFNFLSMELQLILRSPVFLLNFL